MKNIAPDTWLEQEWRGLRRRLVERIAQRASDLGPEPLVVSTAIYSDSIRFEAERRVIFGQTPLLAGLSRELPQPGSVLLFDAAGPAIVIVRTQSGALNAFLNVCPHRGARLVHDHQCRDSFICPFHAWRFDREGQLLQRPLDAAFAVEGAKPELIRVPVAEKYGMIFVRCTSDDAPIDVDEFLGPMAPLLRSFELDKANLIGLDPVSVDANWKLAVDISCEGYHVPATHPQTLNPQLTPFLTIHDHFGLHHRFCGPSRALELCVGKPEQEWPVSNYSAVHYLFPNTVLTYTDAIDGAMPVLAINRSFPGDSVGKSTVLYSTYKPGPATAAADTDFQNLHTAILQINRTEDVPMVEQVWRNYSSLSQPQPVVFGRNEMVLQKYHAEVARCIGMPLG